MNRLLNRVAIPAVFLLLAVPAAFANGSSPQTPAIKSPSTLFTDEQWAKLNRYFDKYAASNSLDQQVGNFLGLARPGETITVRQMMANDHDDKDHLYSHFIARFGPNQDNYIFLYRDMHVVILYGYLTDRNLHFLRGYVSNGTPVALSPQEGEAGFTAEIHWWAKTMDAVPAIP